MNWKNVVNIIPNVVPIRVVTKNISPIILYHSVFEEVPKDIENGLDNVTTDILYEQLSELKKYYTVVSIDEFISLKDKTGYACITFDDAYKNVITNGLKVFEELKVPVTIFVNTSTLNNKVFWRDKVRYILNNELVSDFEKFSKGIIKVDDKGFYKYSKMNLNNSILVEKEIDDFFENMNIKFGIQNYCISLKEQLIKHELVSFGNHSHNHYVLSSLSYDEQYNEINTTKMILDKLDVNKSNVFSLPFGGKDDYNEDTINIVNKLGYSGILMSRNRVCIKNNKGLLYERFMPLKNNLVYSLKKLFIKELIMLNK